MPLPWRLLSEDPVAPTNLEKNLLISIIQIGFGIRGQQRLVLVSCTLLVEVRANPPQELRSPNKSRAASAITFAAFTMPLRPIDKPAHTRFCQL